MKYILIAVLLLSNISFAKTGYEPFKFSCVYDASTDGMITLTSYIDPDIDKWTMTLQSSIYPKIDTVEAESAYVYTIDEEVDSETQNAIDALSKKLKINSNQWYTTTDITVLLNPEVEESKMRIFKFNSNENTLGIGIYTTYLGHSYYTVCK